MQRVAMTWLVHPASWQEYRDIHLNPWPEMIEAIQAAGIRNYSIFALPTEQGARGIRIFSYMEVDGDLEEILALLEQTDVVKKWDAQVLPWVQPEAVDGTNVQFLELEQIFFCA